MKTLPKLTTLYLLLLFAVGANAKSNFDILAELDSGPGNVTVTDNGRIVAKILPQAEPAQVPYFARRRYISSGMKRLIESGRLGPGGTDSTIGISEDREDRA